MLSPALAFKEDIKKAQTAVIDNYRDSRKAEKLLHDLCRNVDHTLDKIWKHFQMPKDCSLIAVGGYGRGELFPHSDVDVLILLSQTPDTDLRDKLENLVQLFWDIGLDIGHSIRTVDECLQESAADITVQTSLLEARLITGSRKLFWELQQRYAEAMNPQKFFQEKLLELQQRHVKYEDTPYSLEPNCKESPGGLRDLQVILWVAKAANLGNSWAELAGRGLITDTEARQLKRNERAFKDIRIRLHAHAGRREDRLIFDVQTPIAESYGFKTTDSRRASEYLMQRYYWAAKAVTQLNQILLQNIEAVLFPQPSVPRPINEHFNEVNGFIDIARDDTFESAPSALLEVFLVLAKHSELKGMTARTLRAMWHARLLMDAEFRHDIFNRALFLQILQSPQGITHALRRMNQMSILGRYLPNFRRIIGQMQHDLFHAYTVDQHILMVVRNLRRFTMAEHAHEYPFCSQLMANFNQPWVLYIAALFHDIAKGRGGDHSVLGMTDAKKFCYDHGLTKANTELVVFLVKNHLTMSHVAQKQDLSDPDVVRNFAALVKDERHLTALYLLTVSDIRGTSPKVWNAWKGKLLEDLYRMTLRVLGGEAPSKDRELKNRQEEALKALRLAGISPDAHERLWEQLDVSYFLRHDASDIAWQTRVLHDKISHPTPVVKCRLAPIGEGLQVTVYVKDQPDLFARICNYFDGKNFGILDAKIYTTKNGYALDTFMVTEPTFANQYRDIINLIEHELSEVLAQQTPLSPPNCGRLSRMSRSFPIVPTVDLRPDERGQYYLLSISANDRNGLLYAIAMVLAKYKINLHTAKVMTLGERVEDVFIVDGAALQGARTQIQFETELLEALRVG
ncbi:[protein-PII] uridylyltransferase [Undibacterium oligocarboniphilum]|uniref:Bifunctional uridylyltransferase/uridylyl-removing enzyme n=1 Tax=Undibacterium oligocarboniphilum TaxID=666702 RepID=A0A850QGD8_9BURK|nr:[protein-PII] uridylyltransferase [Undibacterium oligocarboniphilum]MBC3870367.1 [protein-PII] uridylyltransferase [Undibacterium oligocarboniphilum]NVO78358.1 [protein-PII] uridylyltransferase [Undibacterium oligocarboniphilum]